MLLLHEATASAALRAALAPVVGVESGGAITQALEWSLEVRCSRFLFVYLSYHTTHTTKASPEPRNSASAEALAVTKRGIEGEDPAAGGIERFLSLKGPREEYRQSVIHHPPSESRRSSLTLVCWRQWWMRSLHVEYALMYS